MTTELASVHPARPAHLLTTTDPTEVPRRSFVEHIMGIAMSVHIRGPVARERAGERAVGSAYADLRRDDEMFSLWKPNSPVSRIADGREALSDAHPRIRQVERLCREAEHRTEGAFTAWLPDATGKLHFNPTGVVKGWSVAEATARLVDDLRPYGEHDVMLYAGGDIALHCRRTDTPDWIVGIEDPRMPGKVLGSVAMRTGAVATSGTAARGLHIVNPHTQRSASSMLSATVIGPDLTWADAYATAAFVKGAGAAAWIATLADHAGLFVGLDGRLARASLGRGQDPHR